MILKGKDKEGRESQMMWSLATKELEKKKERKKELSKRQLKNQSALYFRKTKIGNSPAVQWLGLRAFTAGLGFNPCPGIPQDVQRDREKKK